jgi:hypothetical protein
VLTGTSTHKPPTACPFIAAIVIAGNVSIVARVSK